MIRGDEAGRPFELDAAAREAPGTSLEIVPSSRRGNAWLLETGDIDLALGAIVDEAPGIRRMDLLTEGFVCAARKGHPRIDGALDVPGLLQKYFYVSDDVARRVRRGAAPAPPSTARRETRPDPPAPAR
jgi:DNA-binding transcriptional LysR family regulator